MNYKLVRPIDMNYTNNASSRSVIIFQITKEYRYPKCNIYNLDVEQHMEKSSLYDPIIQSFILFLFIKCKKKKKNGYQVRRDGVHKIKFESLCSHICLKLTLKV